MSKKKQQPPVDQALMKEEQGRRALLFARLEAVEARPNVGIDVENHGFP